MAPKRYSDLQLNVLRFYREYLKFANTKPEPLKSSLCVNARAVIEKHRNVPRTKFTFIEFTLRTEANKLQ